MYKALTDVEHQRRAAGGELGQRVAQRERVVGIEITKDPDRRHLVLARDRPGLGLVRVVERCHRRC